jgi:hypothetical protein
MVLQHQLELRQQVLVEQLRSRERGLVAARAGHETEGLAGIGMGGFFGGDAHEGIAGAHPLRHALPAGELAEGIAQDGGVVLVDLQHARIGGFGIGEFFCGKHRGSPSLPRAAPVWGRTALERRGRSGRSFIEKLVRSTILPESAAFTQLQRSR